ncbi:MAG: GNAT family N-acetyltransferase [Marinilabiliaceae bacterium]|nr:GNAT family N-acetyltransferase [Marinilabiliaceae bacterium]
MIESIRFIEPSQHLTELIFVSDVCFGKGYLGFPDFQSQQAVCLGGFIGGQLVGFALNQCISLFTWPDDLEVMKPDLPVHLVKSIAVLPEFRHQGLGDGLLSASLALPQLSSCAYVVGYAWKQVDRVPVHHQFVRHGFLPMMEMPMFWYNDSLAKGYHCDLCGAPPCNCSAVFYLKKNI